MKFCSFMEECHESEIEVQELLNELKSDVSSFAGNTKTVPLRYYFSN